jgi:hypothetical protein
MKRLLFPAVLALAAGCQSRPATAPAPAADVEVGPPPRVVGDTTARPTPAPPAKDAPADRPGL